MDDPLQYVLLHPEGTRGWSPKTYRQYGTTKYISARQFYAYRFHFKSNSYNILHRGRKLFQQYVVDQWAKIEMGKLNFMESKAFQKNFRKHTVQGLIEALSNGTNLHNIGKKRIYLPQSFTGGPRDLANRFRDCMAICRKYGNLIFL